MMNIASLVNQVTAEPPKKQVTQRSTLCPECSERERARSSTTGKLKGYCSECALARLQQYRKRDAMNGSIDE